MSADRGSTNTWKYQKLADAMLEILEEDKCNDTYGLIRMYQVLLLKQPKGVHIPRERTVPGHGGTGNQSPA